MRYALVFSCGFLVLLWERLWSRLWASATVLLFYAALALFGLPLAFGALWHMLLLGGFAVALAATLLKTGTPFVFPAREAIERRLERASGLAHRPLQALRDEPAGKLAPEAEPLWRKHIEKAAQALALLRLYKPQTDVPRRDRWFLRYAALLFFALGLALAQNDAMPRLGRSFTPDASLFTGTPAATLDLWIAPPAYTHEATLFLATADQGIAAQNGPLRVSAGSVLKLRLSGLRFAPRISYAGRKISTTKAAPRNYTLDMPLQKSGALVLSSFFHRLGAWRITVLPDTPPAVSIIKVEATPFAAVKITYQADDDHGIAKLTAIVGADGKSYTFPMPPTTGKETVSDTEDMTANPAAGERATLWLDAKDGAGHITSSAPVSFTLPEKNFTNPLAQRIVLDRKILLHEKGATIHAAIAKDLAAIADKPQAYKGDFTVFLALTSAARRLIYDQRAHAPPSVIALLWNLALRLEDGGLTQARDALENALQHLSQAIADKSASQQQLRQLADDVRNAMRRYLATLAGELAQKLSQGRHMPHLSPELAAQLLQHIDVSKLVAQMQAFSNAHSLKEMQKEAAALKNTLNHFDINAFRQIQKQQAQAMEALQNLQDILHRQQDLFDKTNKTARKATFKKERQTQISIRAALEKTMTKLGDAGMPVPASLADAGAAMKKSAGALDRADREDSLARQTTALDDLQKGIDKTVKRVARALQHAFLPFGMMSGGSGAGYDPLGRPYGAVGSGGIKIPDKGRQRRVQKIIDELQQRESDPARSNIEHNYINRLLNQF